MKKAVALMLVVLGGTGCTVEPGSDLTPRNPVTSKGMSCGESLQGRNMLGAPDQLTANMPGHRYASVQTAASNRSGVSVSVVDGNLVASDSTGVLYSGASASFVGMRLKTQVGGELEITGVTQESYGASYALVNATTRQDYCAGAGSAVAMQGVIESDRFHVATTDVTFGCPDGVLMKCYGWGYVPGADPNGQPWKYHQACMRMANDDIYGNGESHTRNLTPIVIRDLMSGGNPAPLDAPALTTPVLTPPPPGIPFFEGAWGAARGQGALCLAHDRWLSEPIDTTPQTSLPDPRLVDTVEDCDLPSLPQLVQRGALLFNASWRMDMYLNRWWNPDTKDWLTTLRGTFNHRLDRLIPPRAGFQFKGTDAVMLRNLTGTLTDADVTAMYLQHNAATEDYVVATATPVAPGYVIEDPDRDFEGYTLNAPAPDLIPFGLFVKGDDYVSSTFGAAPPGYTFVAPLHYVMRYATADVVPSGTSARPHLGERDGSTCQGQ